MAQRLGYRVVRGALPAGLRGTSIRGEPLIVVRPECYRPREEFAVGHELLELHLPRCLLDVLEQEAKERVCNRGAAALLLPRQPFMSSLAAARWDLAELRRRLPWASWAAIATRIVDLVPGAAAATWVNGTREWWRFTEGVNLGDVAGAEHEAAREAGRHGYSVVRVRGVRARAWRLVARQGRRVTLTIAEQC